MNQSEQRALLQRASDIVYLGEKLKMKRKKLRNLVERGYTYDSEPVKKTIRSFLSLQEERRELEMDQLEAMKRTKV